MRLLPALALLARAANEADAAFRSNRLRLKLLEQEVADLLTRGELADGARAGEHAAVQAEWDATHAADDAAKALRARRVLLQEDAQTLAGRARLRHATTAGAQAQRHAQRAKRLKKRLAALEAQRRSLTASVADAAKAQAHATNVTQTVPPLLTAEREHAKGSDHALETAARAKLVRLQSKLKAAKARHDLGEVAALRWEEGHVQAALQAGKSDSHAHERDLAAKLYVAKKQTPLLAKKLKHLRGKLARVTAATAAVENREVADEALAQNLTAQAALDRIQGSAAAAGHRVPNGTLAGVRQELRAVDAEINATDAQAQRQRQLIAEDERNVAAQEAPAKPSLDATLDASALDSALATDPDQY